ncbi:MAG: hypothetical protein JWM47_2972 [Acidimicrobiales bacterium]|nr:hypothetical protein [Acidimicrobiales bacterium]
MCRYAMAHYKPHFACFGCRKAFKRLLPHQANHVGPEKPARCPQCGNQMADMGLDFAPPKQRDTKAWAVLADLWAIGETFHSCGCDGPGYRPRDARAFAAYLDGLRVTYQCNLRSALDGNGYRSPTDAAAYWRERLALIDRFSAAAT